MQEKSLICINNQNNEYLIAIKKILETNTITKVTYNIKSQYKILQKYGIKLSENTHDILLENYILKGIMQCNEFIKKINQDFLLKESKYFIHKQTNELSPYYDIYHIPHYILKIHYKNKKFLNKEIKLKSILYDIDRPIAKILYEMENNGVLLNCIKLKNQSQEIEKKLACLQLKAYTLANEHFNILSNEQTRHILFHKIGFKNIDKTPKGKNSINETVLKIFSQNHRLPNIILKYRKLYKLKSNYLDKLTKMVNINTGRIHTSYCQHSTSTGRLTSYYPNLQNIPKKTLEGEKIREAFIAPDKYLILTVDYSQIELRILAHFSADKLLIKSFYNKDDVHTATASNIFDIEINKITIQQRQIAKIINFSVIYGITPFGLSKKLNITMKEAKHYIDMYFKKHYGILNFIKKTLVSTSKKGYTSTLFGRKIYIPNINSDNTNIRKAAQRACVNAPMQGTTADIIKKAMIKVNEYLSLTNFQYGKMIIQVHDELIFEIKENKIDEITKNICFIMENITLLNVPLMVNIGIGKNWNQANKIA
uniref:DNA polymerase n=1 Tax=Buchnera aphidicola TaxID=9 RepID=UPI003F5CC3FA